MHKELFKHCVQNIANNYMGKGASQYNVEQ